MLFYLLHNLINNLEFTQSWAESKKNIFTFIIGATCYILLYVFAEYLQRKSGYLIFELFHKFFFYFVIVDAVAMAVLYKLYWGRSILNETMPNEDSNWDFKEEDHKYTKRKNLQEDEIRNFNEKSQKLDELDEEVDELREKTEELETALLYHPDGELAKELKSNFETHVAELYATRQEKDDEIITVEQNDTETNVPSDDSKDESN